MNARDIFKRDERSERIADIIEQRIIDNDNYMYDNVDYIDSYSHLPKKDYFSRTVVNNVKKDLLEPTQYGLTYVEELYEWIYENGNLTKEVVNITYDRYEVDGLIFLYENIIEHELQIEELNEFTKKEREELSDWIDRTIYGDCIIYANAITLVIYISEQDLKKLLIKRWLEYNLPHGSGINGNWVIEVEENGNVAARNCFDYLNEAGYYDGYNYFTVKLPMRNDGYYYRDDMKLVAHNWDYKTVKYWVNGGYREYLEEAIYATLPVTF